jgi:hypothetical protein
MHINLRTTSHSHPDTGNFARVAIDGYPVICAPKRQARAIAREFRNDRSGKLARAFRRTLDEIAARAQERAA